MVDKTSVTYMKGYLRHALEFEKYVYIWTQAMEEANARMLQLYDRRRALEQARESKAGQLEVFDETSARKKKSREKDAVRFKKKARRKLVAIAALVALLIFMIKRTFTHLGGIAFRISGLCVPIFWAIIILLILFLCDRNKSKNSGWEAKNEGGSRRQKALLEAEVADLESELAYDCVLEEETGVKQDEIHKALMAAKEGLRKIYAVNALPEKYQNIVAVATMCEYLETGRCNTIQGHGGIYDTYETERIQMAQLWQLMQINQRLEGIEASQRYICQEITRANGMLSNIQSSLGRIEKTNEQIAQNTAITAAAAQQTAAAVRWFQWNAWANGY